MQGWPYTALLLLVAASARGATIPGGSFAEASSTAWSVALGTSLANLGNSTDTPKRYTTAFSFDFMFGYRSGRLRLGPVLGLQYSYQLDDPAQFQNQNLTGSQFSAGLELQYFFNQRWGVTAGFRPYGFLSLEVLGPNSAQIKYTQYTGWRVSLVRNYFARSWAVFLGQDQYAGVSVGARDSSLTSPIQGFYIGIALMFGNMIPSHATSGPERKHYKHQLRFESP